MCFSVSAAVPGGTYAWGTKERILFASRLNRPPNLRDGFSSAQDRIGITVYLPWRVDRGLT